MANTLYFIDKNALVKLLDLVSVRGKAGDTFMNDNVTNSSRVIIESVCYFYINVTPSVSCISAPFGRVLCG